MEQKESKPRKIIRKLIQKSREKTLSEPPHIFHPHMITFSDFMNIVFYYIYLQPDLKVIANISTLDFYIRLRFVWDLWPARFDGAGLGDIYIAWFSSSKDEMGSAEHYAILSPGFRQKENLLEFFLLPEYVKLATKAWNWQFYKKAIIEKITFPKFRRKINSDKLDIIFEFADDLCERLRKIAKFKNERKIVNK